ncbi:putative lactone-dependent transcriptional regulator (tetr-family), mmfr [Plesiocystis pacifica SIR-1]|uniref:Putative lactone-dependent transcriptional regulator (Tetr-family), mmfr n=1 Tax=Plesiocystis pacifica SIR-1 TaxID=391625 RepID=A6GFJ7_9BACT|nr:TetR/AcrR family transcriptional regulator [Plesiocystis pacifica]EDM75369.1 putative lactone-dependent transcriptional regulator (tetr-family), mmfr [Plesiocystis pacifica SIR-1]
MPTSRSAKASRADVAQQILEQATRLFAAHGFSGVSLADIAKSVGIRKPSLLYHFQSKDTLRRSVLEEILAHWNETLPQLLMAASTGSEQFDTVLSTTVRFFADDPDRARLILRELLDRPEEMQPLIEAHVRPWVGIVADYIRRGQEAGRVRAEVDPRAYVGHMTVLVLGSMATYEAVGSLGPELEVQESSAQLLERQTAELLRIAKVSLFRPRPVADSTTHSQRNQDFGPERPESDD